MNILFVCTNTYRTIAPAPLGGALVAARLRRDGHAVRFLDLMFAKAPAAEAARVARQCRPDLICYAIRNVDNESAQHYFDPLPTIKSIVAAVREASPAPSLLGGTAFTTFPAHLLDALQADYGIAGDDLDTISRFVDSLAAGRPDITVPGLVYRAADGIVRNPFAIRGYADTPFDCWEMLDLRAYRRSLTTFWEAGLVVRTGCPFCCIYCDTFRTFGRTWVLRDPRQVAEEARALQRRGARSVFFADAGFNRPLDHAKSVLDALIRANVRLSFTAIFEPGEVDAEFATLYRRAGGRLATVFAGSLSETVLHRLRKPFQVDDVTQGVRLLRQVGVTDMLMLSLGGPGETPATVDETLLAASRLRSRYTLFDHGYRVQPGTALREIALSEGLLTADDDCFRPTFYHSPATPPTLLRAAINRYQSQHRWDILPALPTMASLLWHKLLP